MVSQHAVNPELIATRILPSGLFESTYGTRNATSSVLTDPRHRSCSCGQTECRHLDDALDMLDNHHCPSCNAYSPFSVLCARCAWGGFDNDPKPIALTPPAISHDIQPGDAQLVLYAAPGAPAGMADIQLLIGPDSVDAEEVLAPSEYIALLLESAAHIVSYVSDYRAAIAAEAVAS